MELVDRGVSIGVGCGATILGGKRFHGRYLLRSDRWRQVDDLLLVLLHRKQGRIEAIFHLVVQQVEDKDGRLFERVAVRATVTATTFKLVVV